MAIQGAPRRIRGQNPNAQQMPAFSPNDFGGQFGNMQIGGMGGMMVRGPNGNMYNPNELPSNLRMAKPDRGGPTAAEFQREGIAPFSRAVFADDYILKPSDQGYMSIPSMGLPNPQLINNRQQQGNMGGGGLLGGAFGDSNPFSYSGSGYAYNAYDPTDNTVTYNRSGIAGNINNGRVNVADLINPENVQQTPFQKGTFYDKDFANSFNKYQATNTARDATAAKFGNLGNLAGQVQGNMSGMAVSQPAYDQPAYDPQTGQGGFINNGVNNMANPYTTDVLTGPAASTSGPSDTMAYGGALLGGLLGNDLSGALQAAGGYYAGQQGIEGAMATGQAGLGLGEAMGKRAYDQSQFRPFGVTSNLANVQTTPEGGVNLNLSPEQQAMQQQLLGQSRGLFGQVGADPAAAQSALYEQIRATQQPEEERQRLQMQENLFSSGRGGVQTAMYGGTPEQMAYEKARQESMLNANLAARTQSQAEQLQAGQLGGMLQQAGYDPQRQAIDLFGASGVPSQLAAKGQLGGAELQSQAGGRGLESYMQGANMANLLQQQQLQGLMTGAVGKPLTAQEQLMNAMIGRLGGTPIEAGGGFLGSVGDRVGGLLSGLFGGGGGGVSSGSGGSAITGSGGFEYAPAVLPSAGGTIDFGNLQAPDDYGQYQL